MHVQDSRESSTKKHEHGKYLQSVNLVGVVFTLDLHVRNVSTTFANQ